METLAGPNRQSKRGRYVVAMVVGTALSAFSPTPSLANVSSEAELRAVHDLSRYCTACWRNARLDPDCWADCTQDVFCRLMERVAPNAWDRMLQVEGEERREFLRAIDAVKKRTQRSRRVGSFIDTVADRHDGRERGLADDREAVQKAAEQVLSSRQQKILRYSFEGWSVHDIASKLHVPAARVSDEKYKAIRKLRERLVSA